MVRDAQGWAQPDLLGRLPGRGAYLCPQTACLQKAADTSALARTWNAPTRLDASSVLARLENHLHSQIRSRLAVCARSGWLVVGRDAVWESLERGRAALILVAEGSSLTQALQAKLTGLQAEARALGRGIPLLLDSPAEDLAAADAHKAVGVVAIQHRGMAARLRADWAFSQKLAKPPQRREVQLTVAADSDKMPHKLSQPGCGEQRR